MLVFGFGANHNFLHLRVLLMCYTYYVFKEVLVEALFCRDVFHILNDR